MVTLLPFVLSAFLSQTPSPAEHAQHADHGPERMGVHGMILLGRSDAAFLSHIPMYRRPHDVQLITAVRLTHPSWKKKAQDFSNTLHTFVPEKFDLTALLEGRLKSFKGTVHRGNFEANGPVLQADVQVEVLRIVRSAPLSEKSTTATPPQFFVFGNPKQAFAVHVIAEAPSYDQVVRVAATGIEPRRLAEGFLVGANARRSEGAARLKAKDEVEVNGGGKLRVLTELSYLVGPEFVPEAPSAAAN